MQMLLVWNNQFCSSLRSIFVYCPEATAVCHSDFLCSNILRDYRWIQYHLVIVTDLWEDHQARQAFRGWGRKASGKGWHLILCFHKFLEHSRTGLGLKHWTTWKPWCQSEWGADAKEAQAFAAENRTCGIPKEGSNKEARCGDMISSSFANVRMCCKLT